MRRRNAVRAGIAALAAVGVAAAMAAPCGAAVSNNLIKNPGAEASAGSTTGATVPVPRWTLSNGTHFTAPATVTLFGEPFDT